MLVDIFLAMLCSEAKFESFAVQLKAILSPCIFGEWIRLNFPALTLLSKGDFIILFYFFCRLHLRQHLDEKLFQVRTIINFVKKLNSNKQFLHSARSASSAPPSGPTCPATSPLSTAAGRTGGNWRRTTYAPWRGAGSSASQVRQKTRIFTQTLKKKILKIRI